LQIAKICSGTVVVVLWWMWWGSKFIIREMQTFHIFIFVSVIDGKLGRQLKITHAIFASPSFHLFWIHESFP
jgi:hypothetical protein